MPSPRLAPLAALLAVLLPALAGCPKDTRPVDPCGAATINGQVLATARDWYLWNAELPPTVNAGAYATPSDLLDFLTAQPRAEGKDRHFSFMTTVTDSTAFFDEGQNVGYGFGLNTVGSQLRVGQVFPGSAAAAAGFGRGDEVLAIASTQAGLGDAASQEAAIAADPTGLALSAALDSGILRTTRWFRVKRLDGSTPPDFSMTTDLYSLDPVPGAAAPVVLTVGTHVVGYLPLRTFIVPAEDLLRTAFAAFKVAGVTDLIVDLRYNGGGRLTTAAILTDLLHGTHAAGDVMYQFDVNNLHLPSNVTFGTEAAALSPGRVAFIVTGGSASASELVVNALQSYLAPAGGARNLAIVGDRTFGKPVGQISFTNTACDVLMALVSFQLLNRDGTGSYFGGLPDADFKGDACLAADDLAHAPGDPAEASTQAALAWIDGGTCPGGPIAAVTPALLSRRAEAAAAFEQGRPTLAQRYIPGLF